MSMESAIFAAISTERKRAHDKHGENSMEGNAWDSPLSLSILGEEVGEVNKVFNELALGNITDKEAKGELIDELIQTAAMCVVWLNNLMAYEGD